jgi:hypothetical protein
LERYKPTPQLVGLELDMDGMDYVLLWLLTLAVPPVFRSICLHHDGLNHPDGIHKFIASLDNSLEHLSFPICGTRSRSIIIRALSLITYRKSDSPHVFDLSHFTQLRSIQIALYYRSPTASLMHLLSSMSSTHLERVAFLVSCPFGNESLLQWNQVDDVLQRSPFDRLKEVYIDCAGHPPSWVFDPILRDMSQCRTRRFLSICKGGVLEAKFYGVGAGTPTEVFECGPPSHH